MTYFGLADPYGFLQCGCGAFCSLAAPEIYFEWGLFLELADPFRFTLSGWFQYSTKLADDEIGFFDLLEISLSTGRSYLWKSLWVTAA